MAYRIHVGLFTVMMVAATALPAGAQLLPQVTPKPAKAPATKPAQIVLEPPPTPRSTSMTNTQAGRVRKAGW